MWVFLVSCALAAEHREQDRVRVRSSRFGECTACGYDLQGLAAGVACPECGHSPSNQSAGAFSGVVPSWQVILALLAQVTLLGLASVRDDLNQAIMMLLAPPSIAGVCQMPWASRHAMSGPADVLLLGAAISPLAIALPQSRRLSAAMWMALGSAGVSVLWAELVVG